MLIASSCGSSVEIDAAQDRPMGNIIRVPQPWDVNINVPTVLVTKVNMTMKLRFSSQEKYRKFGENIGNLHICDIKRPIIII